jgi:predicted ATP-grasp superfamily ATP-dependent carboligase
VPEALLIVGASARAAAFSALRAGLRPACADLFGDADLRARCPVRVLPPQRYPDGFRRLVRQMPVAPWMYTGALENRPRLVQELAALRPLWGNDAAALACVRSPLGLAARLAREGVPCPEVRLPETGAPAGRWLVKPVRGAGGVGIRFWEEGAPLPRKGHFLQEYVAGEPCAALYCGDGRSATFFGATRQLVGAPWLHAAPFHYCGSLGPLSLSPPLRAALQRLGDVLAAGCRLRGLFGVDFVLRGGVPWPVEVNPRYTASVEVLEYARCFPALAWHRRAFEAGGPEPPMPSEGPPQAVLGKAILFARAPLTFPADGPWLPTLRRAAPATEVPAFVDIPPAGQRIEGGRPILTLFAAGASLAACEQRLQETAADLDRWLYQG